jgi:CHAT domain-containing protein
LLDKTGSSVLRPILASIPSNIKRLVISPHQALHLVPFHAWLIPNGGALDEKFEIVYTPSFSLLHRAVGRRRECAGTFLVIENPGNDSNLVFTAAEAASISSRMASVAIVERITGANGRLETVLSAIGKCRVLHYTGHATFDGQEPLNSGLQLSDQRLTLRDLLTRRAVLPKNVLTILNGCETGLLMPEVLDDYQSLTTGFLFAGAQCVLSTLWAVHDLPSALLMEKFQKLLLDGESASAALRASQRWLRSLRSGVELDTVVEEFTQNLPNDLSERCRSQAKLFSDASPGCCFSSPVYWAAFTCNGFGWVNPIGQPNSER